MKREEIVKLEELFEKARESLLSLTGEISIIYHKDSDGISSGVLITKFLEENDKSISTVSVNNLPGIGVGEDLIESAISSENLIILDLPIGQIDKIDKVKENVSKVIAIDHHPSKKEGIETYNPRSINPNLYIPASYLCYRITKNKSFKWLAGVGIIGDKALRYENEEIKNFMKELKKEHPNLLKGISQKEAERSTLGFISKMIDATRAVKGVEGLNQAFQIIKSANNPQDITTSPLLNYLNYYEKELEEEKFRFEQESEYYSESDSFLYEVRSRINLTSTLSSILSEENSGKGIFIISRNKELKISARCEAGRINVGKLLEDLTKGIGRGGGHENAAGGMVRNKHKERFLNKLRERLELGEV